jgi:peptide subunit release factor 1 (eRF1)
MTEVTQTTLMDDLDELASFEPNEFPFISLYLNLQPDQHGRDHFMPFVRKEFSERAKSFPKNSLELASFKLATTRIMSYLRNEVRTSANGVAVFVCAGADVYFKTVQLDAPIQQHQLHISGRPHLYPLARIIDQHPRYVALLANTNAARVFVFDLGKVLISKEIHNPKLSGSHVEGWSQLRYQRHVDNYYLHHAKEVVEMLERVVREEGAEHVILAGDEVIIPVLREHLPAHVRKKVIDILRLNIRTPEHEVLKQTIEALREHNLQSDAEKVRLLLDEFRAGGLAVVGFRDTARSLKHGQVDELLLSASVRDIHDDTGNFDEEVIRLDQLESDHASHLHAADLLVTRARNTGARVTFIEDSALLADVGGVGALLRYQL